MSIGSSLLVPSVQELVKQQGLATVPPRYARLDDQDVASLHQQQPQLPVIDLQSLLDPESMDSELAKLHSACKDWGFFQLVNHGISSGLLEEMKAQVQEFFNLPMEEKKKLWQFPGEVEGFGQTFVVSEEQKLDWSDIFYLVTQPPYLRKPHLLPNLPLPFRDTVEQYSLEVKNLASTILKHVGKALKIEGDEEMKDFYENVRQTMRMNYYPPCPSQINVGDILEIITNGAYRSIEHRALVNSDKERLSIACFHSPRYDGETGPAASLITKETPALFKVVTIREFYNGLFSRQLDGKAYIDTLKIQHNEKP
ncbi:unnamed protein product [Linum tenue]|uniref:Uncharacterized protein n=1 Tax=Linum tenue TaxID=586396 RepID=A0AAV0H2Q9_9ROSI|nr:unnamed protein product [Linum tenue]